MQKLWNIRGVSEGHRRDAKAAAAQLGMTLGKWLEAAIELATGSVVEQAVHRKAKASE